VRPGNSTVYIRARNRRSTRCHRPSFNRWIAIVDTLRAPGCPVRWVPASERFICPCHGGVYDLQGVRVGGPPPRPLDRFFTRLHEGYVQVGARYSVNSELRAFSPRDPGEPLDGIGQYHTIYPSAERAHLMPKLPAPPIPARFLPQPPPPGPSAAARARRSRRARRPASPRSTGFDERTSLSGGVRWARVPQGAEGDELVLHARFGDG